MSHSSLRVTRLTVAMFVALTGAPFAHAANSDPDPAFNGTGVMFRELTTQKVDLGQASALQPDGKILIGGSALILGNNKDFGLIRHNGNGTPDTGFGDGTGKVLTGFNPAADEIRGMVALPQGGALTVGYTYVGDYPQFALAKYTASGALDTSFGGGTGKVQTNFATYGSIARGVALQPDGKFVVVGEAYNTLSKNDFIVARYNSNGTLDTTFGSLGSRIIAISSNNHDAAFGVAIQPDGAIVVAGDYIANPGFGLGLARLTAAGNVDATFGTGGKTTLMPLGLNMWGRGVAVQPDGRIVVIANATITSTNTAIASVIRYNTNGTLDASFNGGGYVMNGFGGGLVPSMTSIELLPTGQILVAGRGLITSQNAYLFLTARYTAAGAQDLAYNGGAGYKLGDAGSTGTATSVTGLALAPDGKFFATGYSANRFAAVKYQGDALDSTPDAVSFGSVANAVASTVQISNVVTIAGLTTGASVPMTVTNGSYSINGNPASTTMGYVKNGDLVMVSHTSSATSGGSVTTTLTIGGVHAANNRALVLGTPGTGTFTSVTQ